ncbi:MAG: hypothetical protein Tsb0021_08340 [Chlamydiales bacterium]
MKRICFLVNDNLYNSKRHFARCLVEGLEEHGIKILTIDLGGGALEVEHIKTLHKWGPELTCSFSSISSLPDGKFIWDHLRIPHLFILVDPPIFYMQFIKSPYTIISCVDRKDCAFLDHANFDTNFFLPHGVDQKWAEAKVEGDRPYDVVLLGSCYDHESLRLSWEKNIPKPYWEVIERSIATVFSEPHTSMPEALVRAINETGVDPRGANLITLSIYIDNYLRGFDRLEVIRAIRSAKVHVFGNLYWDEVGRLKEWKDYLHGHDNIIVHEPVPYDEIFGVLKKAKISLNSTPFFKDGSHERVFNGLAAGCALITNENMYLREQFSSSEGVLFYRHDKREEVEGLVRHWLDDESYRREAALRGKQKVLENHTWQKRAEELLSKLPNMLSKIQTKTAPKM